MAIRTAPDFSRETEFLSKGFLRPCGIDEAGRGPLAGAVVAAAVVLDASRIPQGLNDSKKLSARRREELFSEILATAEIGIGAVSAAEIDSSDIRKATLLAMKRAAEALRTVPDYAIVDGRDVPPGLPCQAEALVSGDALSASVAAASIVAKHIRDRMMQAACREYPGYGFSIHAGYGTRAHLDALERLGPCPIHRMSFKPLKVS